MEPTKPPAGGAPRVLVIDDSNLCRELVMDALRGHGYATLSAADGEDGLSRLKEQQVDLVILDNEMPKMNGLKFLETVRGDPRWEQLPIVMLTSNVSKEILSEAMKRKISGYLLKAKFSMPEMLARVKTAVARGRSAGGRAASGPGKQTAAAKPGGAAMAPKPAAQLPKLKETPPSTTIRPPNLVTRDATLAAIADFKSAKSLAGIVSQIAKIAASGHANITDMAGVIRQDPVLAARVVSLAATAPDGQKSRLATLDDAARAAGVEAVRDLAASVSVLKQFPDSKADGPGMIRCWQHSLAVATTMSRIVPKTDNAPPLLPYLIGLCHDLAEIILRQRFASEFAAAIDFAIQSKVPINGVFASVFGVSYAEVTDALFQALKFPPVIAEPIREFSLNASKPVDAHKNLLARSLAISDFIANGMLLASSADAIIAPVWQNDCRTVLIPTNTINFPEIRSESVTSIAMLTNLSSTDEMAISKPLLRRREVNVWYTRNSSFANLDPIEVALGNLASAHAYDRLPQGNELAGVHGLVILSPTSNSPQLAEALRVRAASGRQIPILHIVPNSEVRDGSTISAGVEEVGHQMSLNRLSQFVSGLKSAD
jgi:two-component system, chemotaxis family, chemotaxis protein CheY